VREKRLSFFGILVSFFVLLALWGAYNFLLRQVISNSLGAWGVELVGELIKLAVWTVPAFVLVRRYSDDMVIPLREMFTTKVKAAPFFLVFLGFAAMNLMNGVIYRGGVTITRPEAIESLVGAVLFVGITEEMVFRGFILNALLKKMESKPSEHAYIYAHVISSLMFVVIHFPGWIYKSEFSGLVAALAGCASIFALSLVFGWAFSKSKNIIVPICLHMSWNLLVLLLVE